MGLFKRRQMKKRNVSQLPAARPDSYITRQAWAVLGGDDTSEKMERLARVNIFYRHNLISRRYQEYKAVEGGFQLYRDASDLRGVFCANEDVLVVRKRPEYVGFDAVQAVA